MAMRREVQQRLDQLLRRLAEQREASQRGGNSQLRPQIELAQATAAEVRVDLERLSPGALEVCTRSLEIQLEWLDALLEGLPELGPAPVGGA